MNSVAKDINVLSTFWCKAVYCIPDSTHRGKVKI